MAHMPLVSKNLKCFKREHNCLVLTPEYLDSNRVCFKKITGTRLAGVLGKSEYNSPFKTWMMMTNLFRDVMEPTLAHVGEVIEPLVRDYVVQLLKINYKVYDPRSVNWDVFADTPIFGGIPDGEPMNDKKQVDYSSGLPMLEIKTTSIDSFKFSFQRNVMSMLKDSSGLPLVKEKNGKRKNWFDSQDQIVIPEEYQFQLGLYLYLRKINKGIFAIAFLNGEDYANPEQFNVANHEVKLVDFNINDQSAFKQYIDYAADWYHKHIEGGVSPIMTQADIDWLDSELALIK